jgi:hypothetical protein
LKRSLVSLIALAAACAQAEAQAPSQAGAPAAPNPPPSPAQLGISRPASGSPVLYVLDKSQTWVPMGTLDPNLHVFYPDLGQSGATGRTSFPTHAALLAGAPIAAFSQGPIEQQGFNRPGDRGWAVYDFDPTSTAAADTIFVILPQGQNPSTPGRYMLRIPASGVHPEAGGALCDTPIGGTVVDDDTAAVQNLLNYMSASKTAQSTLVQTRKVGQSCAIHSASLTIPPNVWLQGVGFPFGKQTVAGYLPFFQVKHGYSILMSSSTGLRDVMIWSEGMPQAAPNMETIAQWQNTYMQDGSIGINATNASDVVLENVATYGFATGVYFNQAAHHRVTNLRGDNGAMIYVTNTFDAGNLIDLVHDDADWALNFASHISTWGTPTVVAGGAAYQVNDIVNVPKGPFSGGQCPTPFAWKVTAVSGGAITGLAINDTGDCTFAGNPQTWGLSGTPTVPAGGGGSGGGTQTGITLTVADSACLTQPTLIGNTSGGALTQITSVSNPGVCPVTGMTTPITAVTGGGLVGATVNVTWGKNPIALAGGSGSGATITINIQDECYRPGVAVTLYNVQGEVLSNSEHECFQKAAVFDNNWETDARYIGGEGGYYNIDHHPIGVDFEHCIGDSYFRTLFAQGEYQSFLLNNLPANSASCTSPPAPAISYAGASNSMVIDGIISGAPIGMNVGQIVTGPNSSGLIDHAVLDIGASGGPPKIAIGPNSGPWTIGNYVSEKPPNTPLNAYFGGPFAWITVDPTATPPLSTQFGWNGIGSLIRNPDCNVDQYNEGAAAAEAVALRCDGWRWNDTAGANVASQRVTYAPSGHLSSLALVNNTPVALTGSQAASLTQSLEGADIVSWGWGSASPTPITLGWCDTEQATGVYDLFVTNAAKTLSYVHPYTITSANVFQCFATVIPGPTTGTWLTGQGQVGLTIGFDQGAGPAATAPAANSWQSGQFTETAGAVQFVAQPANSKRWLSAMFLVPGPFGIIQYRPRPYRDELDLAQAFFQKSFPAGTKVAQNNGTAGAAGMLDSAAAGASNAAMVYFNKPLIASPTVTFFSPGAATANCYDVTKSADLGLAAASLVGTKSFLVTCPPAGGNPAVNDTLAAQWAADSGF